MPEEAINQLNLELKRIHSELKTFIAQPQEAMPPNMVQEQKAAKKPFIKSSNKMLLDPQADPLEEILKKTGDANKKHGPVGSKLDDAIENDLKNDIEDAEIAEEEVVLLEIDLKPKHREAPTLKPGASSEGKPSASSEEKRYPDTPPPRKRKQH